MRQAIRVKFLAPTDTKGGRLKATANAGSVTVPWDYGLEHNENFAFAAESLLKKLEWDTYNKILGGGSLPDGSYAFVLGSLK